MRPEGAMDWKTYEQGKAVGAELKARREAAAQAAAPQKPAQPKSAQPAATTQTGASARGVPAKPAATKTVGAPVSVGAPAKQTKASAVPVVTPPPVDAIPKSKLDADLSQDLKLEDLYRNVQALPSQLESKERVNASVRALKDKTGFQPQRYKELASIQGVDLEDLDKKARGGMPFENYREAKKKAIGFMPVEQRSAMFEEVAKDFAAAEKGEVRTDKRIDLSAAKEAPGTIPGFTTGYVVGGTTAEETPEVVKPGEHYYAVAQKFIEAVDKDPEAVKLANLYGNSFAGGASQKYINDRALQIMKNKRVTPASPDADRQANLARRQATFEVLARKTVGQWVPGIFVKDVQVTDDATQTENPLAALAPNVELIGFNNKGDAVFRQESPAGVVLRTLDLIGVVPIPGKGKVIPIPIPGQSLLAGLATRGEDETYMAAASRGVQTGANWLEYALDESKGAPLPLRALAGLGGMAAAVVHPDVTAAAGSLNKAQKAFRIGRINKQVAKEAVPILEELIKAYRAENFELSSELEKKLAASELLGERTKKHSVVKAFDRNDAAYAMALAAINPALKHTDPFLVDNLIATVSRNGSDDLTALVYETAGTGAPHMHFSAAAPEMAAMGKDGERGASFMTFLDGGNFSRRRERLQMAKAAYLKEVPQTAEAAISKTIDDAIERIKGDPDSARILGIPDADIARNNRLAELMDENRAALIADPSGDTFRNILRADPITGGDANVTWRKGVYQSELARTTRRIKSLTSTDYTSAKAADLQMFDDALEAVNTNVKSRMMAAESLRRNLADLAEIRVTPIDILDDMLVPGTERLSPYAQAGFLTAVRQFPMEEMDRNGLYAAYQALDAVFLARAERNGVPVETIWRDLFVQVTKGDAELPGAAAAKAAGKPPPAAPAVLPATPGDVSKLAAVPTADPKLNAAITAAAKGATKKAAATAKAAPTLHPQTASLLSKLVGLDASAKATPDNVSKILKVIDALGEGAPIPKIPGQTNVLVASVRDQLLDSGALVKLDDGKVVKAAPAAAPAPAPKVEAPAPAPVAAPVAEAAVEAPVEAKIAPAMFETAPEVAPVAAPAKAAKAPRGKKAAAPVVEAKAAEVVAEAAPIGATSMANMFRLGPGGATEALFQKGYQALLDGKSTISGIKDPMLARARPYMDAGLIKNAEDLRRFETSGYPRLAEVVAEAPAAQKAATPVETATADELQFEINTVVDNLDDVVGDIAQAEDAGNERMVAGLTGAEKRLQDKKVDLEARLERLLAQPAPAPPPVATLENLGNREVWTEVKPRGRITAAAAGRPPQLTAKVGGVEFKILSVDAKKNKPAVYKIMATTKGKYESLGGEEGFATLEDALRALTPTAGGPAPLRAEIDSLIRGGVQQADNTAKAAAQAAKKKTLTPTQQLAREFNEAFGYAATDSVSLPTLKAEAKQAGESAAAAGETYEQSFAKYEELVKTALKDPQRVEVALKTIREEFESGLKRGQSLLEPVEAAAPVSAVTKEQQVVKAREEISQLTHVQRTSDGTMVYGKVEGDNFVPMYALGPAQQRNAAGSLYSSITEGRKAIGNPVALAESRAIQVNIQPILARFDALAKDDDLYQTAMVDGKLVKRGKFEVLTPDEIKALRNQDSPTAIITLFRGMADPTTLLHEGAHYIRRMGLEAEDMDAITKWVQSEGIKVEHKFGDFVGDAAEVAKAEERFAVAFEQYLLKGEAPQPALKALFEKVKEVFTKVYRNLAKGPLGKEIQPEVKAVFDRLFTRVPDKKIESTFDMLMRHTFNNKGMEQEGGLTVLAREAKRRGMGGKSVEDLAKLVADAPKKFGNDKWLESVVIDFPAPVFGKTEWTGADILELSNRVQTRRNDLAMAPLKQALFGDPEEETLTESIFTTLVPKKGEGTATSAVRTVGSVFAHSIIGGDITSERHMRNLLPEVRRSLTTSTRIIEQAIGDTIAVLGETIREGNMDLMYRYLSGETGMTYKAGRRIVSSGHEFIDGFLGLYRNAADALTSGDRALLQDFAQAINTRPSLVDDIAKVAPQQRSEALARLVYPTLDELADARAAAKESGEVLGPAPIRSLMGEKATALMKAIENFRGLKGGDDKSVGSQLAAAMRGATEEGAQPSINEFRFTETLLYLSGVTPREGKLFVQAGEDYSKAGMLTASKTLLDDAQKIYGTADNQLFARRIAILVGAYGSASRAKAELAGLGLVLTAEERAAYNNWALGYGVTPEMRPRIEGAMRKLGANTDFQPDTILGVDMYIPRQARERIAEALGKAQFSEQRLTKAGDLYQMAFAYIKKRMTRGNMVLRSRYFMVNTIDHFFQLSLIVGYAPAFQSFARIALQNVLMSPFTGQALESIVRGLNVIPGVKLNPAVTEKIRDALSRAGDAAAFGLRKMFSDSKYRVEVNHVLEGRNTPIVIGGHVTTGKRLREIMVGEGILESYNTRRLGQVIRQEGTAFINEGDGVIRAGIDDRRLGGNVTTAWAKVKDAATDITFNVVDDLGDAWAERERIGAAVTLIENGYEPRLACRLTVDALYDYAQSMTKGDRSWLVGLMFPFWAFQKNANQQFINVLATPYGAYRMMVMKRFRDRGSELLTELYYDAVGGELGLDVNEMPQDMQDMYYAIMTQAHEVYGDEIPEDAKLALRMALTGRSSEVVNGKYYELDDSLIGMLKAGGVAGVGGAAMSEYMLPRPDRNILPSYMRERPGVFIAQRRNAQVRLYSGLRGKNDELFYLMLPEASFESAFKHVATVFATGLLVGGYVSAVTPAGPLLKKMGVVDETLTERGLEGTKFLQAIKPVLDLERSPIAGPVIGMYAERGYPQRLDPYLASMIQNFTDVPVLRVPALNDPFENDNFLLQMEKIGTEGGPKDMNEILGADYVRTVKELNSKDIDPNDLATIRDERFYLPPGGYSIAFENTLGEINKEMLIKWSQTPAERAESGELLDMGNIIFMLRNLTGVEAASVSASRTAQQEEPVFYTKSRKPF